MVTVDPTKYTRFRNISCAATGDITEVLSTIIPTTNNGHWKKWATFCRYLALNPLLVIYRESIPFLSALARQYMTGDIYPSGYQAQSH